MNVHSDKQLIKAYLAGDEKALEVLIHRYLKPVYGFVYRYVGAGEAAEDITQEVFVKTWKHLKRFKQGKSFRAWIFTIAKNLSIDFLRKKKAIPFSRFENEKGENMLTEMLADSGPLPNEFFEQAGLIKKVRVAINQLALKYRLVLLLRHSDLLTFREIAELVGEPVNTVKSRHRRALFVLKKLLAN